MKPLRTGWRLARGVAHALHGLAICAAVFPFVDAAGRDRRVAWWSARMLHVLGIRLDATGVPLPGPVLVVANHVSWLDVLAINSLVPVRFVAKADLRRWPLIGWMAACGGTLFIERERKRDALRVVHQIAASLRAEERVAVFPEGTTSAGDRLLPFHANLLEAAVATGTVLQPVALRFSDASSRTSGRAAYVGEMSLMRSAWLIAGASAMVAHVSHLPPVPADGVDRRMLASAACKAIAAALTPGCGS